MCSSFKSYNMLHRKRKYLSLIFRRIVACTCPVSRCMSGAIFFHYVSMLYGRMIKSFRTWNTSQLRHHLFRQLPPRLHVDDVAWSHSNGTVGLLQTLFLGLLNQLFNSPMSFFNLLGTPPKHCNNPQHSFCIWSQELLSFCL